ncbi:MAG: hypothetical protein QG597_1715, partial [Actinomycetota bacterium]|nr:hypothetical protein [Actinomycetota bacterium]
MDVVDKVAGERWSRGVGAGRDLRPWWWAWAMTAGLTALVAGLCGGAVPQAAAAAPTGNVTVDPGWQPTGGIGDLVATSVLQADGKVVVVGPFTSVNGVPRVTITRLNADGTLDPSFDAGAGFDGPVRDLVLQPDGKILAAGKFTHVDGVTRLLVARLLPNGDVDPTFVPQFPNSGPAITPAVAGRRTVTSWRDTPASAQFLPDSAIGTAAATRGAATVEPATGDPYVQGLALQGDGKVVYFGAYLNFTGTRVMGRFHSDGTVDATFTAPYTTGQTIGDAIALPDGTAVVGGYDYINSQPILARLRANGSLDPTWVASGCNGAVWHLQRLATGRILASGGFTGCGGIDRRGLVRLLATGAVDPTFATGTGFEAEGEPMGPDDIVEMPDGRLLAVGYFTTVNGVGRPGIARLTAAGALDISFVPSTPSSSAATSRDGYVWKVQVQADAGVLIAGEFGAVAGVPRTGLARLTASGALDPAYNPVLTVGVGVDSWAADALVQPDGKVVVAGGFGTYNSDPAQALVRLNANGTRDVTFSTAGTGLAFVDAVVRQPDGRYIVAGAVVVTPTAFVLAVLRLNSDGSRDPSFVAQRYDLGMDQRIVSTMVLQPDGKVLVAGQFTGPGGRTNLMRLIPQGPPDAGFSIGTGFTYPAWGLLGVRTVVLQPDGRIVAAGAFDHVNGVPRSGIVRLQPGGAVDPSFNPGAGFTGTQMAIRALASAPGGRLWAAGRFDFYNGQSRQSIARLNGDGSLDASFVPAGQFLQPYLPT